MYNLTDIERKVLTIIWNDMHVRRRPPSLRELSIRTGRTPSGIKRVLASLAKKNHIDWTGEEIILLEPSKKHYYNNNEENGIDFSYLK